MSMTPSVSLGRRVRELRQSHGWTQEALAERANVAQTFVSQVETGRIERPSYEYLRRLASALGVPVDNLMAAAGLLEVAGEEPRTADDALIAVLEMRPVLGEQVRALRAKYGEARFRRIMGPVLRAWQSNLEMAAEVALDAAGDGSGEHRRE